MPLRVALLGIFHESNTFIGTPTTLDDFRKGHWLTGSDIRNEYQDAFHEIGGMMEVLDMEDVELVPVMYAEATPGGAVASSAYQYLLQRMLDLLDDQLPVDGCLVVPHGAGVAEDHPDMDGHWLNALREKLGEGIPIIGTVDPHANMTRRMISATTALIAYKTNPHIDQRETGKAAARMLMDSLLGKQKPVQALIELPLAISIEQQYTGNEPCRSLYACAGRLSQQPKLLSISILLGFPYADVREMGTSVIVVADMDRNLALAAGEQLGGYILDYKEDFVGIKTDPLASLSSLAECKKPVLLLDMGDNIGGGAPGDSAFLLHALERQGKYRYFICLWNPEAVVLAAHYDSGQSFRISIGSEESPGDDPVIEVSLLRRADGKFTEPNPRHGGQVNYDMGEIAIVSTRRGNAVMLTSLRVPPFSLRQLTAFGINPEDFDVVVAKGVNAPLAAYGPVCPTIIQVNTPGVTRADMTQFNYNNRRRPLFPFETW